MTVTVSATVKRGPQRWAYIYVALGFALSIAISHAVSHLDLRWFQVAGAADCREYRQVAEPAAPEGPPVGCPAHGRGSAAGALFLRGGI
jgi:hypothetical protein